MTYIYVCACVTKEDQVFAFGVDRATGGDICGMHWMLILQKLSFLFYPTIRNEGGNK